MSYDQKKQNSADKSHSNTNSGQKNPQGQGQGRFDQQPTSGSTRKQSHGSDHQKSHK